jgi:hypothetical protein
MNGVAAEGEAAGTVRAGLWAAWDRASVAERVGQAVTLAVLLGLVVLGLALEPSPTGAGTHCQLGLPACGMLETTGLPCPTCGVTTAFCLAAHGRPAEALVTQPFGLALFLLAAGGGLGLAAALAAGRSVRPVLTPWTLATAGVALMLLLLGSWAYKLATA